MSFYNRSPYYDPVLSRFISADPLYSEQMDKRGINSQELNLYAYASNSPINKIDPEGTAAVSVQGEVMAFFGFRGVSNNVSGAVSVDLNPFSQTFLKTEVGMLGASTQKFGVGLAASAEAGVGLSIGNSSIKELAGGSFGVSGGVGVPQVGGAGGSVSYGERVMSGSIGLKGPGVVGYGSFDIGNSTVLSEKNLFKGVDLFEGVRSYFDNNTSTSSDSNQSDVNSQTEVNNGSEM